MRRQRLLDAQDRAAALFDAVVDHDIIRPGTWDSEASRAIAALAAEQFGVQRHWHKRIVRSGPNTLQPYQVNPPDRQMTDDDIVFGDFGPIFDGWEADYGRTWVLGDDPVKVRLRDDLAEVFSAGKAHFDAHPDLTGETLHQEVVRLAHERGWTFGNVHCGHLVGQFPHERPAGGSPAGYLTAGNATPLRAVDASGRRQHWILEIHLVDHDRQIGGFYEQLLTVP